MPKISVIVPVYNVEKYLHRCIDSILAQIFTDFELLLVDDGSTDGSGSICDEYAKKDSRVRVFHKANGGVSSARNMGLDHARGEWITFVDSDDWLADSFSFSMIDDDDEDLIVFSYEDTHEDRISYNIEEGCWKTAAEIREFMRQNINSFMMKCPWAKFYKRKLIGNLRFDTNMRVSEDNLFVLNYLSKIQSCKVYEDLMYIYNDEGVFERKYQQSIGQSIYTLKKILESFERLHIENTDFLRSIFYVCKALCQQEIYQHPDLWYKNPVVKVTYRKVRNSFGLSYRMRYYFMQFILVSKIHAYFKQKNV
ncbi:MAG: glycosyltransferase [Bacteroides sp.]|nr:glycosyltransferase [Roseburia sp.]MCM1346017.1 glycosyltransferase [Bacteroides sp.]MCM1421483.1 glycosyltransferase [Bacteroides sp.]